MAGTVERTGMARINRSRAILCNCRSAFARGIADDGFAIGAKRRARVYTTAAAAATRPFFCLYPCARFPIFPACNISRTRRARIYTRIVYNARARVGQHRPQNGNNLGANVFGRNRRRRVFTRLRVRATVGTSRRCVTCIV